MCCQNGTLKIVDRKKHIFKLAQGEYIAPEKIENVYLRSEAVAQVFVHGDSLQVKAAPLQSDSGMHLTVCAQSDKVPCVSAVLPDRHRGP